MFIPIRDTNHNFNLFNPPIGLKPKGVGSIYKEHTHSTAYFWKKMKDNENGIAKILLQGGTPMNKAEH